MVDNIRYFSSNNWDLLNDFDSRLESLVRAVLLLRLQCDRGRQGAPVAHSYTRTQHTKKKLLHFSSRFQSLFSVLRTNCVENIAFQSVVARYCAFIWESLVESLSGGEFSEELNRLELSAVLHANNILLRWTPGFGLTHKVRPKREFSGKTGHSVHKVQILTIGPQAVVASVHRCSWLRIRNFGPGVLD